MFVQAEAEVEHAGKLARTFRLNAYACVADLVSPVLAHLVNPKLPVSHLKATITEAAVSVQHQIPPEQRLRLINLPYWLSLVRGDSEGKPCSGPPGEAMAGYTKY